jgi:serine/threonine-protein kinase
MTGPGHTTPAKDAVTLTGAPARAGDAGASDAAALPRAAPDAEPALERGAVIGRYLTLSLLGRGGMGEVHAAYDPELDRRVAVKILYTARDTEDAKKRLLREARALGKLSHPNVVQVYDAGEHRGDVFIAMELVEGTALDAYCRAEPRPGWRAVVAAYLDAARGLAAAHEKGLIHRDVKPSNLLRGRDGRVRVADFGIAKGRDEARDDEPAASPASLPAAAGALGIEETLPAQTSPESLPGHALTRTGALMGTPLYLAPEQHEARRATPASDQYSLCVALHEGLYGAPPFHTESATLPAMMAELHAQKLAGVPAAPPPGADVPAWVHRTVARGLAPRPEDRYPSLEALIAALGRDPEAARRARRRGVAGVVGAAALGALALAGWAQRGAREDGCAHVDRELAGVWDAAVAGRVRAAFVASGRGSAEVTATRVAALLDASTAAWTQMRREVCEAARAQPHPPLVELREACLSRRRAQIGALTTLLAEKPDPEIVDKAVQAAGGLPPVSVCADAEALTARVRPPEDPAVRARVAELWPRVDRLEALYTAGKFSDGAALGEPLLAEIGPLPYAPLRAQAQYAQSRLRDGLGDYEAAKTLLRAAAASASEGRDDLLGATAWARLLFITGERQRRYDEAAIIRALGPTALARVHDARVEAAWLNAEGLLLFRTGKHDEAHDKHTLALSLREKAVGPEHLDTAISLNNLGILLNDMGRPQEAREALTRAVAIREKNLGPDHPEVSLSLHNLAVVEARSGNFPAATAAFERALGAEERTLGPEHPDLVRPLSGLGEVAFSAGDLDRARAYYERALRIGDKALGPEHALVAAVLAQLGQVEVQAGRAEIAREQLTRSLALLTRAEGADNPSLSLPLLCLGQLEAAGGKPDRALPLLERAVALNGQIGDAEIPLADVLWSTGGDRARARDLAGRALAHANRFGDRIRKDRAERWLAAHPSAGP